MLYDRRWDQQKTTEATPTLEGFIAWAETKCPSQEYDPCRPSICAMGQYHRHLGIPYTVSLPLWWQREVVLSSPFTFGAALQRAYACSVYDVERLGRERRGRPPPSASLEEYLDLAEMTNAV